MKMRIHCKSKNAPWSSPLLLGAGAQIIDDYGNSKCLIAYGYGTLTELALLALVGRAVDDCSDRSEAFVVYGSGIESRIRQFMERGGVTREGRAFYGNEYLETLAKHYSTGRLCFKAAGNQAKCVADLAAWAARDYARDLAPRLPELLKLHGYNHIVAVRDFDPQELKKAA